MPLAVRSHPRCLAHDPGLGHPETARRVEVVLDALEIGAAGRWVVDREAELPPDDDTLGLLRWVHDADHIERLRAASQRGHGWLDTQDCRVSAGTFDAALAAAGLALGSALDLVNGRLEKAFLAVRPPSHHAERGRASGYCFFNSIAIAAEVVVSSWGGPVVVADFSAHHGNGTQRHFYDRSEVGTVSVHGYPGFTGTGGADEIGVGRGAGSNRNVPLAEGADDSIFCAAFEDALEDVASQLRPAVILLAAGFDAHAADPVGGMRVSEAGFRRMTAAVNAVAGSHAGGRVLSFLEGGFDLQALANCARIHVEELTTDEQEKADA